MRYDTIIIGAGLSGLAAGIRLAMFDKKVCIVEKHVEIGGLNSFYVRKNRIFDVGLHAMTNYTPKGVRSSPLGKLLKQLRFSHDDFRLCQQDMIQRVLHLCYLMKQTSSSLPEMDMVLPEKVISGFH